MNIIKKFVILVLFITLYSCAVTIEKKSDKEEKLYFTSKGFALIYDKKLFEEGLVNKKINNEKISSMHSFLKPGTLIQIINLSNSKSVYISTTSGTFVSVTSFLPNKDYWAEECKEHPSKKECLFYCD